MVTDFGRFQPGEEVTDFGQLLGGREAGKRCLALGPIRRELKRRRSAWGCDGRALFGFPLGEGALPGEAEGGTTGYLRARGRTRRSRQLC
jgi:hypothetical protein